MKGPRGLGLFLIALLYLPLTPFARQEQPQKRVSPEPQEQKEPVYNPYQAEKAVEAGTFYLKKGKYDAAVNRFEQALRYQPNLAKAYRLLGEAHEKRGDKVQALRSYQKYLQLLPSAEDAQKVRKRIEKLQRQL